MLDPLPIGQPEPKNALKCEVCGLYFGEDQDKDRDHVDETGMCRFCWNHYS